MANFIDDLIRRLGVSVPEAKAYLRNLEIDQRSAGAAADAVRGGTWSMRARNARRPFLDELSDVDLTPEPKLTPRDIARRQNDDARMDAQYGPFEPGSPGVMWDIRRSAERNLAEARAARAAKAEAAAAAARDRNQFIGNTAMSAGAATALGTAAASSIMAARERAAREQDAINEHLASQNAARAAAAEEADLMSYGDWDDEAATKAALLRKLPMADMDPLGDMVTDMPMKFDLPPAPAQSQSDTAKLKSEYKTPPGIPPRRSVR